MTMPDDACLLALGERLRTAWAAERATLDRTAPEAECFDAMNASRDLVDEINGIPAKTLAGLKVKALAYAWCREEDICRHAEGATTDERVLASLFADIEAM